MISLFALFRWVVFDIALLITQAIISLMDQKSWPAPAAERPNPLIYKAEKDWKKDGLNPPVFPLAGLMLLIRYRPVRPPGCVRHVYAAWMRGCVDVCVRVSVRVVVSCAPECTRECTRGVPEGRLSVIV